MRLSRYIPAASVCIFQESHGQKARGFCLGKSPLDGSGYLASFSKRYSRTSTCISSSRSILQIMLRALL